MNAKHNRDRSVDELLRHALLATPATQVSEGCLDAETLAAWVDGGLDAAALARAETHAASCARCQALVAAMVRTAPEPVLRTAWWRRDWRVRWVVPLTAAATAALLWMVVPDRAIPPSANDGRQFYVRPDASAPAPPPPAETPPSGRLQPQSSADAKREALASPLARERDASARGAAVGQRAEAKPRADAPVPSSPSRSAAPSAPPVGAAAAGTLAAETREAAKDAVDTRDSLRGRGALNKRLAAEIEILSPDPAIRWRLDPDGSVHYSTNSGATWELLSTGIQADLTAGSSPSFFVCWLVGRGGIVLRTVDGRSWQRVPFPESVDLASVWALDAQTAIITTGDGRTFRTTDVGQTWSRDAPQDFQASPF